MKIISIISIIILAVTCLPGCTSTYWGDRGRDATDVFTASIGIGVGAKSRIGLVQFALLAQADGAGLRGGEILAYGHQDSWVPPNFDLQGLVYGSEIFSGSGFMSLRHKKFTAKSIGPFISKIDKDEIAPYYYSQIEFVAAFGGSIRFGFNLGEFLDLMLGWTTIDIYEDDIGSSKENNNNVEPITTPNQH